MATSTSSSFGSASPSMIVCISSQNASMCTIRSSTKTSVSPMAWAVRTTFKVLEAVGRLNDMSIRADGTIVVRYGRATRGCHQQCLGLLCSIYMPLPFSEFLSGSLEVPGRPKLGSLQHGSNRLSDTKADIKAVLSVPHLNGAQKPMSLRLDSFEV